MKPSSCLAELSALDARLPSLRAAFRLTSQGYIFTWSYLVTCDARHTSRAPNCCWKFSAERVMRKAFFLQQKSCCRLKSSARVFCRYPFWFWIERKYFAVHTPRCLCQWVCRPFWLIFCFSKLNHSFFDLHLAVIAYIASAIATWYVVILWTFLFRIG